MLYFLQDIHHFCLSCLVTTVGAGSSKQFVHMDHRLLHGLLDRGEVSLVFLILGDKFLGVA